MERLNSIVDRYIATWNEPDGEMRRRAIREVWANDGVHRSPAIDTQGLEALYERTAGTFEKWGKNGFVFRRLDDADGHHDVVRFRWELLPADGGPRAAMAMDVIVLAADGRIRFGYQFPEPSATP